MPTSARLREAERRPDVRRYPAWVGALLVVSTGCSAHYPDYQMTSFPELEQNALEPRGETTDAFVESLEQAGASNIHVAHGLAPDGALVDAVAADYLYHVYLFRDDTYLDRVRIPVDAGRAAVHPLVKVVLNGERSAVVLLADVMTVGGRRAGLLVQFDGDGVTSSTPLPMHGLIAKHGGMRDPYVGGTDLGQGILVTARDDGGTPWPRIYVLRLEAGKLEVQEVPYGEGFKCSCFQDWLNGQDGRTLFGEVVE
jgi:hypothetical protein